MVVRGRGPLAIAAALALLPLAVYWRMLTPGWAPMGYDEVVYFIPLRHYLAEAWAGGRLLPLWDPDLFMGAPFLANIQDAALYPPNLIFALLPTPNALAWSVALHLSLAGIGMFLYARRAEKLRLSGSAVAAVVFVLGGYLTNHLGHLNQVNTLAWAPWLMLATDRLVVRPGPRRAGLLALAAAAVVLAGHTQQAYFSFVLAGLVAVRRLLPLLRGRAWRAAAVRAGAGVGAGALGAGIAGLQLLATFELTRLSIRSGGLSLADAGVLPLAPRGMLGAVLPDYSAQQNPETSAYLGVAALALGLLAVLLRPRRPWTAALAAIGLMGLWAALGPKGGLYTVLYHAVPGLGLFRGPGRLLLFTQVAGALLAGHGTRAAVQLAAARARGRPLPAAALAAFGLAGALALAVILYRLLRAPTAYPLAVLPPMRLSVGAGQLAFVLLAAALLLAPVLGRRRRVTAAAAGLPLLVAVELVVAGAPTYERHPIRDSAYEPAATAAQLVEATPDRRFLSLGGGQLQPPAVPAGLDAAERQAYVETVERERIFQPDTSLGSGRLTADGYDGGILPLAGLVRYRRPLLPADSGNNIDFPIFFLTAQVFSVDWLRDSGVATVVTPAGANPNPPGCTECLEVSGSAGDLVAWRPPGPAPTRAYLLTSGGRVAAQVVEDSGEVVRVRLPGGQAGTLVLSDAWYPGWTATVDGRPAAVGQHQDFLRAVEVPAGATEVEFRYRPWWLIPGVASSVLSLLAALALLALPGYRKRAIQASRG